MLRSLCLLTGSFVVSATFLMAQTAGRISGTVISEDGVEVDRVNVCTSMTSGNSTGITCLTPVDSEGHFQINNVNFGNYEMFAVNEEEGYSIANQSPGLKITVNPENPSPNILIRLRSRGGVVTGSVRDKVSGKAIDDAWISCTAIDNGGGGSSQRTLKGRFSLATPTDSNLLIYVTARGYKGWVYSDSANPVQAVVRLASGERRVLDIELEPLSKASGVQ